MCPAAGSALALACSAPGLCWIRWRACCCLGHGWVLKARGEKDDGEQGLHELDGFPVCKSSRPPVVRSAAKAAGRDPAGISRVQSLGWACQPHLRTRPQPGSPELPPVVGARLAASKRGWRGTQWALQQASCAGWGWLRPPGSICFLSWSRIPLSHCRHGRRCSCCAHPVCLQQRLSVPCAAAGPVGGPSMGAACFVLSLAGRLCRNARPPWAVSTNS